MKRLILVYLLSVLCQVSYGTGISGKPLRTVIAGRMANGRSDTFSLSFYPMRLGISRAGEVVTQEISPNGEFHFVLPAFTGTAYVMLISSEWPRLYLDNYLVEPGDSIYVSADPAGIPRIRNIFASGLTFSGTSPGKFRARYFTDSVGDIRYRKGWAAGPPPRRREPRFDSLYQELDSSFQLQLAERLGGLETYRAHISERAYEIMKADTRYKLLGVGLTHFSLALDRAGKYPDSAERRQTLAAFFHSRFENEAEARQTNEVARQYSWAYLDFAARRTMQAAYFDENGIEKTNATKYLKHIAALPKALQEKIYTIIAAYLYTYTTGMKGMKEYLGTALQNTSDPFLSGLLFDYQSMMLAGAPLYPFSLPDISGKLVSNEDLKGRAVFLDLWFTGCTACIKLHRALKPVKSAVKGDPDIVFLSISIDTDRQKWLKSVDGGLYTDKESINLYTAGMGNNHPFLRHYHFTACPKTMVIDAAGKIFSADPPWPDTA
ncbi:MAG: hypothetical protein JWQ78_977, partial [Sediminibacterium sp.]|nr:hypothetical protein [Sediminibacterium sp.]